MASNITQRNVGDVVVLDCQGRLTLGEGAGLLRDTIRGLIGLGRRHFALNFENVTYIDSSGIGEMVAAISTVTHMGGSLKAFGVGGKVHDLLQITKLYTVFETFDNEELALRSFVAVTHRFSCPVCGSDVRLPTPASQDYANGQQCKDCEAWIKLPQNARKSSELPLERIVLHMYPGEEILVIGGHPIRLEIYGRVNLFTSTFLKKSWRAVPAPHKVLISLHKVTELDSSGAEVLTALVNAESGDRRIAVSLDGLERGYRTLLPSAPPFFTDEVTATQSLGDVSSAPELLVRLQVG